MPAELMTFLKLRPILSGWGNSQLQAALTLGVPPQKCPISAPETSRQILQSSRLG